MPIEIRGNQMRIRVKDPKKFKQIRTQDVGSAGRLQRVSGMIAGGRWETQAWSLNLQDYPSKDAAESDIKRLRISKSKKGRAIVLLNKWWREND